MVSVLFGGKRTLMAVFHTLGFRGVSSFTCNSRVATEMGPLWISLVSQSTNLINKFIGTSSVLRWCSNDSKVLNHPKRPVSAYSHFFREKHPIFRKQNPDIRSTELMKIIAVAWKELSLEQKQHYEATSEVDKQRYKEEIANYKAHLSPIQLANLKEDRRQRLEKRKGMKKKRELTELGRPKRCRSPFNIYMSEHYQEAKGASVQAKLKTLFEDWTNLDDAQKQLYIQLAEDDQVRYRNEIESWEEQMIELGREDLIRKAQQRMLRKKGRVKGGISVIRTISTEGRRSTKAVKSDKSTSFKTVKSSTTVNEE